MQEDEVLRCFRWNGGKHPEGMSEMSRGSSVANTPGGGNRYEHPGRGGGMRFEPFQRFLPMPESGTASGVQTIISYYSGGGALLATG